MPPATPASASVRIIEPERERHGVVFVTTYRVLLLAPAGHPCEGLHDARRRYSDFDFLATTLAARYVGMVVPPLPGKGGMLGSWSAGFVEQRVRGLALFAERLARTPTLLLDTLTSAFFGLPDAEPWKTAMARADTMRVSPERMYNPGLLRWEQLISRVALPEDAQDTERLASAVSRELAAVDKALGEIERAAEGVVATATAHAEAQAALAAATSAWSRLEDADIVALNTVVGGARPAAGSSRPRSPVSVGGGGRCGGGGGAAIPGAGGQIVGEPSPLGHVLRALSGFVSLEARVQQSQPAVTESLLLESIRFERRVVLEAARIAAHRHAIAAAHTKAQAAVRAAVGAPRPRDVSHARALHDELQTLDRAFLLLEVPRLAGARLEAASELAGHVLAVRSSHGGLLEQAASAFFDACARTTPGTAAERAACSVERRAPNGLGALLPSALREAMQPPRLLAVASSILGDCGSPHALLAATSASWRPEALASAPSASQPATAAHSGGGAPAADEGKLVRRRSSKSGSSRRHRASSPQAVDASAAPAAAPPPMDEQTAIASPPPETPPTVSAVSTSQPPGMTSAEGPAGLSVDQQADEESAGQSGRNALLDDIRRLRRE